MIKETYILTPDIEQILSVHNQLWEGMSIITYKDQSQSSYSPSHNGYRSVILNNANGIPHMWITQNMSKSSYGTMAIEKAKSKGEDLRITWVVKVENGQFIYRSRISTHFFPNQEKQPIIEIETYKDELTEVLYSNDPNKYKIRSII